MLTLTQRAVTAVGPDEPAKDWRLRPLEHAATLPYDAQPLKVVLQSPAVQNIMSTFVADDAAAVAAQAVYKRAGHWGLKLATAAAIIGALFLLPFETWFGDTARSVALAAQFVALAGAMAASRYLIWKRPFDTWMKARGRAEIARVALFDAVIAADGPVTPNEIPLLPLQLEYFRRYQLSVQRNYYSGQGSKHQSAAGASRAWQLLSVLVTALASVIIVTGLIDWLVATHVPLPDPVSRAADWIKAWRPPWSDRALLAAGIVSSALYSFASSRSLMNLDERNASRYLTNAENLQYLTETGLDAARVAAADGRPEEVNRFVQSVQGLARR